MFSSCDSFVDSSVDDDVGVDDVGVDDGAGGLQLLFLTQLKCLVHAFIHIE